MSRFRFALLIPVISYIALFAAEPRTAFIPHYTQTPDSWSTTVTINNPTFSTQTIQIQAYNADGQDVGRHSLQLQAHQSFSGSVSALIPSLTADKGWLQIEADPSVTGMMTFRSLSTGGVSSLPMVEPTGKNLLLSRLDHNQTSQAGFAVINQENEEATLAVTLVDMNGGNTRRIFREMPAKGKLVAMVTELFGSDLPEQFYLTLSGSTQISGFALLFENQAAQIVAVPGSPWQYDLAPTIESVIQANVGELIISGANVSVTTPGADFVEAAGGFADLETQTPMTTDTVGQIGSLAKTFTATLALQLQEEGRLDLDQTIDTWYPDFPKSNIVTVRMCLNHSSGIPDYLNSRLFEAVLEIPGDKYWNPEDLFPYATDLPFYFEPGTSGKYSNTNYVIVRGIIEKITGDTFANQLRTRILDPLNLEHTFLVDGETITAPRATPYFYDPEDGSLEDLTHFYHRSLTWGAAGMASTAGDLNRWMTQLFSGAILSEASMAEMLEPVVHDDGVPYGLGIVLIFDANGELMIAGHGGQFLDATASVLMNFQTGTLIATVINQGQPLTVGLLDALVSDAIFP